MPKGCVMVDLLGTELGPEEKERLAQPAVGGLILFSRNYESPLQISELIQAVRALKQPPLLIAVDQEGGRVQRFQKGLSRLPALARIGELYQRDQQAGLRAAYHMGWLMAAELLSLGIDFSFAPVLDLHSEHSPVIGDRAFAAEPETVAKLGYQWMQGARAAGMASVGKHFPGHGLVPVDSHHDLPIDERPFTTLWQQDMLPFRRLVKQGIEALMPAHIVFSQCDEQPAGYSHFWLQQVLRQRMGFQGMIFSDDLSMVGAQQAGSYAERAQAALQAGCDMVLVCNQPAAADEVIEQLKDYQNPTSQSRLLRMHGQKKWTLNQLHHHHHYANAQHYLEQLLPPESPDLI